MNREKSNTKINSSTNKLKRRSVGTNTDGNFKSTNCMNCFQEINHPKIYFVPYVTCMNNPCFQNNMAGTINACKCKCSSQTNVYDYETAFQCSQSVHGNRSSLPPWEKHIGDNNERVSNTCQTDKMEHITKNASKTNLSISNSSPTLNVNNLNLPKQSHIPHRTLERITENRLSNNLIDVEQHANELLNQNSRFQINDEVVKKEKSNEKIYKLLVPSSCQGNDSDENCSASENEETEEENAFNFSEFNENQSPDETMLMVMKALVCDRDESKRDSKLTKLLNNLGFVGETPNENMDISFTYMQKK